MEMFNGESGGGSMCWPGITAIFPCAVDFWELFRKEKTPVTKVEANMTSAHRPCARVTDCQLTRVQSIQGRPGYQRGMGLYPSRGSRVLSRERESLSFLVVGTRVDLAL